MTDAQSLSALARVRPCRIAFLVDPDRCPAELFDAILDTTLHLWGGRCHAIVPVQAGTIADEYWRLLVFTDPDIIYTYADLPQPLLRRIDRAVCPLEVRAHPAQALEQTPPYYRPHNIVHNLADIHPWLPIVLARERRIKEAKVLTSRACGDWGARRFALRNFGVLGETGLLSQYLGSGDALPMTPDRTEAMVLNDITGERSTVIFPHGVAAYWADLEEPTHASQEYALVLGDDVWAPLFAWNRAAHIATFMRQQWHTMWLPHALLQEAGFRTALNGFLSRHVLRFGNTPSPLQIWHSAASGLAETDARALIGDVIRNVDCIPEYRQLNPGQFPAMVSDYDRFHQFGGPPGLRQYRPPLFQLRASEPSFLVQLPADIAERAIGTKMMDLEVEYRRQWHGYTNQRFWWRLPKVLGITRYFGPPGRVCTDGVVSFVIGRDAAAVEINVPRETSVISHLLIGDRTPPFTGDPRTSNPRPFMDLEFSDKGKYNRGIITLFGGIFHAGQFFKHNYWRGVIESLAGRAAADEARIVSDLKERLRAEQDLLSKAGAGVEAALEQVAQFILRLARRQQIGPAEVSFKGLRDRAGQERGAFNRANPARARSTSPSAELRAVLQQLTEAKVFLQGAHITCDHCGSTFWYEAAGLASHVRCQGCGESIPLPVEAEWSYRLNALLQHGVAHHGCIPVLVALADLSFDARTFFVTEPGVNLFATRDGPIAAELDLVGIHDGSFFIGEVKTEGADFRDDELEELAGLARTLEAHLVVIAAFRDGGQVMSKHASTLRGQLAETDIVVRVLVPNERCFQPQLDVVY